LQTKEVLFCSSSRLYFLPTVFWWSSRQLYIVFFFIFNGNSQILFFGLGNYSQFWTRNLTFSGLRGGVLFYRKTINIYIPHHRLIIVKPELVYDWTLIKHVHMIRDRTLIKHNLKDLFNESLSNRIEGFKIFIGQL